MNRSTKFAISNQIWVMRRKVEQCNNNILAMGNDLEKEKDLRAEWQKNLDELLEDAKELGFAHELGGGIQTERQEIKG